MKEASAKQMDFIDRLLKQKGVSEAELQELTDNVRKVVDGHVKVEDMNVITMAQARMIIGNLMDRDDSPDHEVPRATDRQIGYIERLVVKIGAPSVLDAVGNNWHEIEDGDSIRATIEAADHIDMKQASSLIGFLKQYVPSQYDGGGGRILWQGATRSYDYAAVAQASNKGLAEIEARGGA